MKNELIKMVKEIKEQMEIHKSMYFMTSIGKKQEEELGKLIYEVYGIFQTKFQVNSKGELQGFLTNPYKPVVEFEWTLDIENDILIETNRETNITTNHKLTVHTTPSGDNQ